MRAVTLALCALLMAALPAAQAPATHGRWTPLAYAPAPPDNPLKGFFPYRGVYTTFPHSMEWEMVAWRRVLLRVEHPLRNRRPLRFANAAWQADVVGWLSLGDVTVGGQQQGGQQLGRSDQAECRGAGGPLVAMPAGRDRTAPSKSRTSAGQPSASPRIRDEQECRRLGSMPVTYSLAGPCAG